MLDYVFAATGKASGKRNPNEELSVETIEDLISNELEALNDYTREQKGDTGRLGPKHVVFDSNTSVGGLNIDKEKLGLFGQGNFSSILSNTCVYRGKWQYEVMLGSVGVMQIGWATSGCKFSKEKGVGDTPDSFAFDGSRIQKWNVTSHKYGEPWSLGDIIGCVIDLDNGKMAFYRNGVSLGEAFNCVRMGPGFAYFPAVSLAFSENLIANFGARPFRYQVPGYQPLQSVPELEVMKCQRLLCWMEKVVLQFLENKLDSDASAFPLSEKNVLLVAAPVIRELGPLLVSPYVVEACLLSFIYRLAKNGQDKLFALLDILWTLLEPEEMEQFLEHLFYALVSAYRFSPVSLEFSQQKQALSLILAILHHQTTRQYLLGSSLFDKIKLPLIFDTRQLDNRILEETFCGVQFSFTEQSTTDDIVNSGPFKDVFLKIQEHLSELEKLQLDILDLLLDSQNINQDNNCNENFLRKFHDFVKENTNKSKFPPAQSCHSSVNLGFFHRLVTLLRRGDVKQDMYVPLRFFCSHNKPYSHTQRAGGLISYLTKSFAEELKERESTSDFRHSSGSRSFDLQLLSNLDHRPIHDNIASLLDGIVRLYHYSAHRQLEKLYSIKEKMQEYMNVLTEVRKLVSNADEDARDLLVQTCKVYQEKLQELAYQLGWLSAAVLSWEREMDVFWLLYMLLQTLEQASKAGVLFAFVPDFYIEACINTSKALVSVFSSTSQCRYPGYMETLTRFGTFLAEHFADKRIVNADLKDLLIETLASYVCNRVTLRALESIPVESCLTMVSSLLQPYENRAWAQSNWILVRIWKGCGYAFRYTVPSYFAQTFGPRYHLTLEKNSAINQEPCPSVFFQQMVTEWLLQNQQAAAAFLSSVLSQLNWAFSEFIGMLQELQNASLRPERVFVDSRQLKICATCFNLTLGLLRLLEMVVHSASALFTDWTRPSAEVLLSSLCQLICQILNRMSSRSGCFEVVVNLEVRGLEAVHHFPIITAVVGILVSLILESPKESSQLALNVLLSEPSFQLHSFDAILGASVSTESNTSNLNLAKYTEVTLTELSQASQLMAMLTSTYQQKASEASQEIEEEYLCTICYASPKSTVFQPCGHQSCRACISHHLLHHKECFFCKVVITKVTTNDGTVLHESREDTKES
ncbi:E3 ubiquitin-protein ligase RNF123-like isoform X1 [Tachypleus tridentatus]|uniref:E3 ubiquitin-protein ligase RNF123-like isoform X1 n=1 Tax=Tachypleus tridentatus TaxID=6853 RepID=UPI003FD04D49